MTTADENAASRRSFGANPFEALKGRYAPREPGAAEEPPPPARAQPASSAARIVVRREKKGRAGKTMTRISGLALDGARLEALARELKRALGCGAVVEEGDVLLQGAQTERAAEWLRARGFADVRAGN